MKIWRSRDGNQAQRLVNRGRQGKLKGKLRFVSKNSTKLTGFWRSRLFSINPCPLFPSGRELMKWVKCQQIPIQKIKIYGFLGRKGLPDCAPGPEELEVAKLIFFLRLICPVAQFCFSSQKVPNRSKFERELLPGLWSWDLQEGKTQCLGLNTTFNWIEDLLLLKMSFYPY